MPYKQNIYRRLFSHPARMILSHAQCLEEMTSTLARNCTSCRVRDEPGICKTFVVMRSWRKKRPEKVSASVCVSGSAKAEPIGAKRARVTSSSSSVGSTPQWHHVTWRIRRGEFVVETFICVNNFMEILHCNACWWWCMAVLDHVLKNVRNQARAWWNAWTLPAPLSCLSDSPAMQHWFATWAVLWPPNSEMENRFQCSIHQVFVKNTTVHPSHHWLNL